MARMGAEGIDKAGVLNQIAARFAARASSKLIDRNHMKQHLEKVLALSGEPDTAS